jgi:hypothetical protein
MTGLFKMKIGSPFFGMKHQLHATKTCGENFANSRSKWTGSRGGSVIKERHVHHQRELGVGRYAKPQAIILNMSARPWRLSVHLHHPGPSKGGILTCPRDGTDGHAIKMR